MTCSSARMGLEASDFISHSNNDRGGASTGPLLSMVDHLRSVDSPRRRVLWAAASWGLLAFHGRSHWRMDFWLCWRNGRTSAICVWDILCGDECGAVPGRGPSCRLPRDLLVGQCLRLRPRAMMQNEKLVGCRPGGVGLLNVQLGETEARGFFGELDELGDELAHWGAGTPCVAEDSE